MGHAARIFFTCIYLLLLMGCEKSLPPETPAVITEQAEAWSAHLAEYPRRWVAAEAPLWVRFNHPVVSEEMLNRHLDGVVTFVPKIPVNVVFTSPQELRITPVERLAAEQVFRVSLQPEKLRGVDQSLPPLTFTIQAIRQDFALQLAGLTPQETGEHQMRLMGEMQTADTADLAQVRQVLQVSVNGREVALQWSQAADRKTHRFSVENIPRGETQGVVRLTWDGTPLGSDTRGARELPLPARSVFTITGTRVVHQPETYVEIQFSAPLNRQQNLTGLVTLGQQPAQVRIDGTSLRVYPPEVAAKPVELRVSELVQSSTRQLLGEAYQQQLVLALVQPMVRFVGGEAGILPPAARLSVPFEAAGVDSVQVVAFKIYDNNLGQYLQRNRLNASYPDQTTGRYLWRKDYPLPEIPRSGPQRFQLDLTELMAQHPDGLLRIELRIDRSNAILACPGERPSKPQAEVLDNDDGEMDYGREQTPDWYQQYYQSGGYYTYNERHNPCHDAYYYYGDSHSSARTFMVSDIGLLAKRGSDHNLLVVATGLRDAEPLTGAVIKVFNYQHQLIGRGRTDHHGMVDIATEGTPYYLMAEQAAMRGYLRMPRNEALPTNQFDVSGEHVKAGLKGFIYGERDVWRPGDDIYLSFMLQDNEDRLPPGHPVALDLFDPRGKKHTSLTQIEPLGDVYLFPLKTEEDAPTGNWRAVVHVGNRFFDKIIKVEAVTPNRLKIEVTPQATPLRSDALPLAVDLFSQWLHGASAGGLKADSELKLFSRPTGFPGFAQFVFDDPARRFATSGQKVFEGKLDTQGRARFNVDLAIESPPPGMLTALFNTRVFEESGNFSTALRAYEFHPFSHWVGLQVPKGEGYAEAISRDQDHPVYFQSLGSDGKPAPGRRLEVTLYAIDWRWWWDDSGEDLANYVGGREHRPLKTETLVTDANGRATWTLTKNTYEWGRHLVRVCDTASDHCAGQVVYLGWSWDTQANPEAATQLMLTTDKENYQVGEVAKIRLPQATQGRALLSLENGSRVLERRWLDLPGGAAEVAVPITSGMAPTVYAHLTLLLPHQQRDSDAPIRLYGIAPLLIEDPATRLQPQLELPDQLRPETEFTIAVGEVSGRAMTYTLALVDEGLLGLTGFTVPDAHGHFYRREALGVQTWDLFDQVVGAYGASLERVLAIGGSDAQQEAERQRRERRFPPIVKFLGAFTLAPGETRQHKLTLPPYMGAVRAMLVAVGPNAAYGAAEKTVTVTQPLVIMATLPRVLGPGEEVVLPVNVFVSDPTLKEVEISLEASELFTVLNPTARLQFPQTGDGIAGLHLRVNDHIGKGWVKVTARSGKETASQEIYIDSRPANPPSLIWETHRVAPGETWQAELKPQGLAGTNAASIEVSVLPPLHLERRLNYLLNYPHGCLEQLTSAAFPQLFLAKLTPLSDQQKADIDRYMAAAIHKLRGMQDASGAFSYWPGDGFVNEWASSYAGHFLLEARRAGYAVPVDLLTAWIARQRELARNGGSSEDSRVAAYRLYTLALADQAELPAMNRLRERLHRDATQPASARWLLVKAYQQLGLKEVAGDLLGPVSPALFAAVPQYQDSGYTYGSALRDRSLLLLTLLTGGFAEQEVSWQLAESIAAELGSDQWHSTQSTAWALMAMSEFAAHLGVHGQAMQFSLRETSSAPWQALVSQQPVYRQSLPSPAVEIKNESEHSLRVLVSNRGIPAALEDKPAARGLKLDVTFYDMNNQVLDVQQLPHGTDFVAEVTVSADFAHLPVNRLEDIALSMIIPSGWQIRNERLEEGAKPAGFDYVDLRDDRILAYFSLWRDHHWHYRYQDPTQSQVTLRVILNASYAGRYYLPGWQASAMYDERIQARSEGYWVEVRGGVRAAAPDTGR